MLPLTRRQFGSMLLLLGARPASLLRAASLDDTLGEALQRRKIPAATAMVSTADKTLYSGAFGARDSASRVKVTTESIFSIASMTKAITSTAAMQLVEQGKVTLDEPLGKYLPQLSKLDVLEGFDKTTGKPILRPAKKPVTLRLLLSHSSGFAYDTWNDKMSKYAALLTPVTPGAVNPSYPNALWGHAPLPLVFEPGTQWQYGPSADFAALLVEKISGQTLAQYFQRNIFDPLGMKDTTYILPPEKFDRLVSIYQRQTDGSLKENPRRQPAAPKAFFGGSGLFSTAGDYTRFMQMILRRGRTADNQPILQPKSVEMMSTNQIGRISAGKMNKFPPDPPQDIRFHPGAVDGFGLGFLINATAYEGGRSAGSLAWAGGYNTYYWMDPRQGICAILMMHFSPFFDDDAVAVLNDFERAVYRTVRS
jgi:methyl acetate hydrolase